MKNRTVKLRIVFSLIMLSVVFLLSITVLIAYYFLGYSYIYSPLTPTLSKGFIRFLIFAGAIGWLIEWYINKKIFQPIKVLNQSMKEVAKGNFDLDFGEKSNISEIREMMSYFELMTKELSNIEVFRNDFVNSVSHEFKTPLTAIEGYATLLQSEGLSDEERQKYVTSIINGTKRLSNLATNILKLSRLENQELLLEKSKFNLAEQIRTATLTLEREWSAKEIELDIELEEIHYNGNHDLLFQVWMNLIHNAVKFTPYGGEIKISLKYENQKTIFQVIDNGAGMTIEARKHIFDKFYQSDKSQNSEGNGLGLPLVRRIISLHEGMIDVKSTVDVGSTFTVTLV